MMSRMTVADVRVRVHAGARREELRPTDDGWIVARVSAPAQEGRANKALCRIVAKQLRIAPSNVGIVRGARSREKLIRVQGMDQAAVNAALGIHHD
jgi:uncharacterized protein